MRAAEANCPIRLEDEDLVGNTSPRIFTPPLRPLNPDTSAGFDLIAFAHDVVGMHLLPWEQEVAIRALEMHPNGKRFRFRTIILLVARQNGKSTLAQALSLWHLYVYGTKLIIGTAQDLDVAEELWGGCVEIAETVPVLADNIEAVVRTNGKKSLDLVGKHRYKVKAANRKAGRGLSGDLILLDELREHTKWDSWGAVTKTAMARGRAQIWGLSNAGDDTSVVLMSLRKKAHWSLGDPDGINDDPTGLGKETNGSIGIFEYSAAPGRDTKDRAGWQEANPSLGYTISEATLEDAEATDPEAVFRTECLCQWVQTMASGPFPEGTWEACADPNSEIPLENPVTYAADVTHDGSAAYLAVAGMRADGRYHVEIIQARPGRNWDQWIPEWVEKVSDQAGGLPVRMVINSKGCPAAALLGPLEKLQDKGKCQLVEWYGGDVSIGCGHFHRRVAVADPNAENKDGLLPLAHRHQEALNLAASTAAQRFYGDGWYWDRRNSPQDAAPLVAATAALWDQIENPPPEPSIYDTDEDVPLF